MKYENIVAVVSNYATDELPKALERHGQNGFQFVNSVIAKNKYFVDVMYLFFTKEIDHPADKGGERKE